MWALVFVSLIVILLTWHRYSHRHHNQYPYVYSMLPYFGASIHFRHGTVRCVQRWVRQYGTIFNITMLGEPLTLIADPALFPTISKHPQLSLVPLKTRMMGVGFGSHTYASLPDETIHSIATATRKSLTTTLGFHKPSLDAFNDVSATTLLRKLQLPPTPTRVALYPYLNEALFETLLEVFYGTGLSTPAFRADFNAWDAKFTALYAGFPATWLGVEAPRRRMHATLRQYAATCRDKLSSVVTDRLSICESHGVSPSDTDGHQLSFVWAMTTNTMRACFWTICYLQEHPAAWAAVQAEVESHVGANATWDRDAIEKCVRLESAIKETLRLALNSSAVRYAVDDVTLDFPDGRRLAMRKGDGLVLQSNIAYYDEAAFPDPHSFVYDRFLANPSLAKDFTPFGFGKYLCPGQHYAMDFVKIVVTTLMLRATILSVEGRATLQHNSVGVYIPKAPLAVHVTIQARQAPHA
ncbi:hypothetical protein SPRG_08902 [Saprolegnia parasitica CBS 223.65]|uniref:Cytochrome P450 n=1 Tax=Saprolegnia parasitica (strain CBS 223.65) TaxID=695850 RepID=A0A067C504_SAPPC|nr:hypothetical protein SPRG_08902 [Saprolegnia parasitica CBS 223.65]KDO25603.1 hypothetical protein SPRG_08902 [Saprolegnia parasitica CBS 223.65]|eukprot:XP_012203637.1 hypothetical protein SPRG_08902 [Saprolegnia parasitica CBS 223.65]